ncbi:MAG TPA: hypothetical protein VFJ16_07705 [Longimicrobium sp.]|nr:hypothetical protein [Longimicrobium sp.]
MGKNYLREVDVYRDIAGRSDVAETMHQLRRTDQRAARAIDNRVNLLRQVELREAVRRKKLVKQATANIYVLRVQSGSVSFRLPFFESPCHDRKLVLLTHCEHRSLLRGDRYKALIESAERRREDWIRRNCQGGRR